MNSSNKCCFCVAIKVGVVTFGVGSIIMFAVLTLISVVLLGLEDKQSETMIASVKYKIVSINAILVPVLIVSVLVVLFSIVLLIGIFKRIPGLLLTYFAFGVMNTMVMLIGSLLFLIHNYWYISLASFLVIAFYFYCLLLVYKLYELIQRGFDLNLEDQIEDQLLNVE